MQATAKISSQGQITIPLEIREILGIRQGDYVTFEIISRHPKTSDKKIGEQGNDKVPCSA